MRKVKNLIIGFGKAGKTLAGNLAKHGEEVVLVEESEMMYGGTCINVACIPSKAMEYAGRLAKNEQGSFEDKAHTYLEAVNNKRILTATLRGKNYDKVVNSGAEVMLGKASFIGEKQVEVLHQDGSKDELEAERIFINTGSRPFIPPIPGLKDAKHAYTSEGMLDLDQLPKKLIILGGGYIGLEFASFYANFGSEVTIIQDSEAFIPREDPEISEAVLKDLLNRNIKVLKLTKTLEVINTEDGIKLSIENKDGLSEIEANALLIATGRRPNVQDLSVEKAGIKLTPRGAIEVDEKLRTSVNNIWAMGDVAGGLQFTYISLDDYRIVQSQLFNDGSRTNQNRGYVPYSVFIDPPLSRVGMSEPEAIQAGYKVKIAKLPANAIPKAKILKQQNGLLKAIIDADTDLILGAHLYMVDSHEVINLVKIAMDAKLPYTVLRDAIYTHPTMSEALNDLFGSVK